MATYANNDMNLFKAVKVSRFISISLYKLSLFVEHLCYRRDRTGAYQMNHLSSRLCILIPYCCISLKRIQPVLKVFLITKNSSVKD